MLPEPLGTRSVWGRSTFNHDSSLMRVTDGWTTEEAGGGAFGGPWMRRSSVKIGSVSWTRGPEHLPRNLECLERIYAFTIGSKHIHRIMPECFVRSHWLTPRAPDSGGVDDARALDRH